MAADPLEMLVAAELAEPVDERVRVMAAALAACYPEAARAVLFYGSCLRERVLDGLMLDFYLIVSDYRVAYQGRWLPLANRLLPPNVFPFVHDGLTAKYAVLSEADFARELGPNASSVSVWARFAQPARLVWAADSGASQATVRCVARAAPTFFRRAAPMSEGLSADPLDIWRCGFAMTYSAELRAERGARPGAIVDADPERYRRFGRAAIERMVVEGGALPSRAQAARWWSAARRKGKGLSVLRLAKATTTFAGGIDYIAWKINRHAGTGIVLKPWQRRWPILAGLILLPRLLRGGAVR